MAAPGVVINDENIRAWNCRFGKLFANTLTRRRPWSSNQSHTAVVFVRSPGEPHRLWCAIDQDGIMLDIVLHQSLCKSLRPKFFSQIVEGFALRPARNRNGKIEETYRDETREPARSRAPANQTNQQLERGFASADTATRTSRNAVQIAPLRTAVPSRPLPYPQSPPPSPQSLFRHQTSCRARGRIRQPAKRNQNCACRMKRNPDIGDICPLSVNPTAPVPEGAS